MPPKNKNKRKNQGKRKNSQQGSNASSPSIKAASSGASPPCVDTPATATSSTVSEELITPGALQLRLSQIGQPNLGAVDEEESLPTPSASDVMSDEPSPDPSKEDVEYQEEDGIKTPTAASPQMPQSTKTGATAAAAAATGAGVAGLAKENAKEQYNEAPSSYAQKTAEPPLTQEMSPPRSESPKNPFRDNKSESTVEAGPATQTQQTTVVEETTFDEVPLGTTDSSTKPAVMSSTVEEPHRVMNADEVPTLQAAGPVKSVGEPAPGQASNPLASPPKQHETGNPFLSPGTPLEQESLEEYRSRTHMGYDKPRPSEPFMQADAAPDSAPTDNFVSNSGANQARTEEPQNVWAPGQQGFERSEHAPSTTSAAKDPAPVDAAPSSNFVVEDSSPSVIEDEPDFTREGQTGLWTGPTSPSSQTLSSRQLTPAEGTMPDNRPPTSYPFPAHTTAAAHDDNQSPKSLLPSDPHLPLPDPDTFEPRASNIAPLGPNSTDNVRQSIDLPELSQENLDGFLNPWTRSQQMLAEGKGRVPSPAEIAAEEAAISTPDLSELTKIKSTGVIDHTRPMDRTASANSNRSNEPLMPTTGLFAGKKYAHLNKTTNAQLRAARPSVIMPRGPNKKSSNYTPQSTSSGRSSRTGKIPPPEVVETEFDDIRIEPAPSNHQSEPRDRFPSLVTPAPVFMRARNARRGQWERWNNMSRRMRFFVIAVAAVIIALVIGLAVGLVRRRDNDASESSNFEPNKPLARAVWEPKAGNSWDYQTRNRLKSKAQLDVRNLERNPTGAAVFDIDLFQNDKELIHELHANGTKVICSFSAGTVEIWRPDANYFPAQAQGLGQADHLGARWLNIKDQTVQQLMRKRIDLAVHKDCDAVDPTFVDVYQFAAEITEDDAGDYVKMLAEHAHSKNLAIGLRSAPELAPRVMDIVDFSVCESCSKTKDCEAYQKFLDAGKPVFHVEYTNETQTVLEETSKEQLESICNTKGSEGFSTIVKRHNQDEWVVHCAGRAQTDG